MRNVRSPSTQSQTRDRLAWVISDLVSAPPQDPGALLDRAAELVCEGMADSCVVGVLSDSGAEIHPLGVFHPDEERREGLRSISDLTSAPVAGAVETLLATGEPALLDPADVTAVARMSPWAATFLDDSKPQVALAIAMRALGAQVGVLAMARSAERAPFDDVDVEVCKLVGDQLGLAIHALHLEEELESLRNDPVELDAGDGRLVALSERERAIFRSIGEGLSSREIAEGLYLSVRTVEWHRARLMAKLGTNKRSELIALARELRP